jgi:hypothetical protein
MLIGQTVPSAKGALSCIKNLVSEVRLQSVRRPGVVVPLKALYLDEQFMTKEIVAYCRRPEVNILLFVAPPYEHQQIGRIERSGRTIIEAMNKAAVNKPQVKPTWFAMNYHDALYKINLVHTSPDRPCPYVLWHGVPFDIRDQPLLPFASVVVARTPLELQTKMSGRGKLMYYVGTAAGHNGCIQVLNPETNRIRILRTFRVIGPKDPPLPMGTLSTDPLAIVVDEDIIEENAQHAPLPIVNLVPIPAVVPLPLPVAPVILDVPVPVVFDGVPLVFDVAPLPADVPPVVSVAPVAPAVIPAARSARTSISHASSS